MDDKREHGAKMNEKRDENLSNETQPTPPDIRDAALEALYEADSNDELQARTVPAAEPSRAAGGEPTPDEPSPAKITVDNDSDPCRLSVEELQNIRREVSALAETQFATREQLDQVQSEIASLKDQVSCLPPQLRRIAGKVDGVTTAVADASYKTLLLRLIGILDLVDGMRATHAAKPHGAEDVARHYEVLATQLRQVLDANGVSEIPTNGPFDPNIHHSVKRVEQEDPALHNRVLHVVRPGFRTEQQPIRYAEVTVGYCPGSDEISEADDSGKVPAGEEKGESSDEVKDRPASESNLT